jgi:hypothetical protein
MPNIKIFDDAFSWSDRQHFYGFLRDSSYQIIGGAGLTIEQSSDVALQSLYSYQDLINFGFMERLPQCVKDAYAGYEPTRSYGLIVNHLQQPHFHTDTGIQDRLTLLYYANLYWDKDWGGETIFTDDKVDEVIYTSRLVPGRIVLFDSKIPHKPSTPSVKADAFRLTFVINLAKKA